MFKKCIFLLVGLLFVKSAFCQPLLTELQQTIKKNKASQIKTLIHVSGGELRLSGGAKELAQVYLSYNKEEWDPTISFAEDTDFGKLTIIAKSTNEKNSIDNKNVCNLQLNEHLNYSLGLVLGAGVAEADFSGFDISKALFRLGVGSFKFNLSNTSIPLLKVDAGIGEVTFDLSGEWHNNLSAIMKAGIGQLKLIVPANTGVKLKVKGFLGSVETPGYQKEGKEYTNSSYEDSKYKLEFDITGAVGTVIVEEKK